jgi:broad specificity phosphatase PhoE
MTRLVLVRHGETEWHEENRYAGKTDVALTANGLAQASELAQWAATAQLAAIWSSTLARAQLTAAACGAACGLVVQADSRLCELDFGDGEGLTRSEMSQQFPDALNAFSIDPVGDHFPGGEDPVAAASRFTACLFDIAYEQPTARVLVVAHSTAIRLALCELIGVPLRRYRGLFPTMANCSLTEIEILNKSTSVIEFNSPLHQRSGA